MSYRHRFHLEAVIELSAPTLSGRVGQRWRYRLADLFKQRVRFKLDRSRAGELFGYADAARVSWPVMVEAAVLASLENPAGMLRIVGMENEIAVNAPARPADGAQAVLARVIAGK